MDIDLYKSVVAFVRKTNKASISHIQRNFYLGYARASEIMDKLESEYVVSRMSASGRRDVYPEIVANLNAEIDDLKVKLAKLDRDADQLLTERDEMQEFAEKLKDRLQEVFNQDFGDHSNANCPFTNALEYDDS
ncbi:DNA translocase FtsK, partial [Acinetobacter brisouii]